MFNITGMVQSDMKKIYKHARKAAIKEYKRDQKAIFHHWCEFTFMFVPQYGGDNNRWHMSYSVCHPNDKYSKKEGKYAVIQRFDNGGNMPVWGYFGDIDRFDLDAWCADFANLVKP